MFCATFSNRRSCNAKLQIIKIASCKDHSDKSWYDSVEIFSVLSFFRNGCILTGLLSFNFKITHSKNHFDTTLVKIHSVVIFMFCAIFSNSRRRSPRNAKLQKIKMALDKKPSGTKLD